MDFSPKRFKFSNTQSLQLFHLLRQGTLILTSVLLAKSRLTVADIGAYELLLYLGYTLSFWWVSGFIQGVLTRYPQLPRAEQQQLFFNTYLLFIGISFVLFILFLSFPSYLLKLFTGQTAFRFFEILLPFILLSFPTYLLENFLLLQEKPKEIVAYGIFSFVTQPLAVMLPVWLGLDFEWSMWGLTIVIGLKHVWLLINVWQNGAWRFHWQVIKNLIYLSAPLIIYALLGGINSAFDNWLVNFHYQGDPAQFAIFRYGAQELPLTLALTNALSMAMLPEVAKNLPEALLAIKHKSLRLFHFLFPLCIVIILTDRWLFPLVFNPVFIASVPVFNIFLLILISRLVFARTVLVGLQANKEILYISVFELILNGILSFILVQHWGMIGVAIGTLVAYSVEKVLLCAYLYLRFGVPVGAYTDMKWFSIYSIALAAAYALTFFYT